MSPKIRPLPARRREEVCRMSTIDIARHRVITRHLLAPRQESVDVGGELVVMLKEEPVGILLAGRARLATDSHQGDCGALPTRAGHDVRRNRRQRSFWEAGQLAHHPRFRGGPRFERRSRGVRRFTELRLVRVRRRFDIDEHLAHPLRRHCHRALSGWLSHVQQHPLRHEFQPGKGRLRKVPVLRLWWRTLL